MNFIFAILLLIASIVDLKIREIPHSVCLGIFIISLANFHPFGVFATLPLLISAVINPANMGGGDVKLTASVGCYLGFVNTVYGVMIGLMATIMMYIFISIHNKKFSKTQEAPVPELQQTNVPLAPFLAVGFLTVLFI